MYTEPADTAALDQADDAKAAAARRRQASREIRNRGLCEHDGYSGTDPITGVVLCAICRRTGQVTPAYPAVRRPARRPAHDTRAVTP
jgi:hypothetical protein